MKNAQNDELEMALAYKPKKANNNKYFYILLAFPLFAIYLTTNFKKVTSSVSQDDNALFLELSANHGLKGSFRHLSAARRLCSTGDNRACNLLKSLLAEYSWLELQPMSNNPVNINIADLKSKGQMSVILGFKLKGDHVGIGKIEDLEKVFNLGRSLFQNWIIRGMINNPQFEELQWIMLIHGYSLDEWAQNGPRVLEDEPIEHLNLPKPWMNSILKGNGFHTVGDVMKFIRRKKDLWEEKLTEEIKNQNIHGPLKDVLVKVGYAAEIENISRQ